MYRKAEYPFYDNFVRLLRQVGNTEQISVNEPPKQFAELSVALCMEYGTLHNGQKAIEALLEAAKQYVGSDKQTLCDQLIQQLQAEQES